MTCLAARDREPVNALMHRDYSPRREALRYRWTCSLTASKVTPEFLAMLSRHADTARLSDAQVAALALARAEYDVDRAVLRRLGLPASAARPVVAD